VNSSIPRTPIRRVAFAKMPSPAIDHSSADIRPNVTSDLANISAATERSQAAPSLGAGCSK
jgi:hypothetical protein